MPTCALPITRPLSPEVVRKSYLHLRQVRANNWVLSLGKLSRRLLGGQFGCASCPFGTLRHQPREQPDGEASGGRSHPAGTFAGHLDPVHQPRLRAEAMREEAKGAEVPWEAPSAPKRVKLRFECIFCRSRLFPRSVPGRSCREWVTSGHKRRQ